MTRPPLYTQDLFDCRDVALVGGKADNLGRLLRAGFSVPGGFVVTTRAFRHARAAQLRGDGIPVRTSSAADSGNGNGSASREQDVMQAGKPALQERLPDDLADQIRAAYEAMGSGRVAVRSSATAEDSAAASMAGQYETFLHVTDEASLLDAIRCCWASLDSPRTRAYLGEHGIDPAQVAMAVVVQRLVSADVAGVLFTANPQTGTRREMLVEASWGLGEAVVSGLVQPDVLRLDLATGKVLDATIADKRVYIAPGEREERPVDESRRKARCLRSADVARLWQLGRRAAEYFGSPQDLEWAIQGNDLYLLQSRPITTLAEAEAYEELLRDTRADLREKLAAGQGPWVLHNLAETLPHPTPFTWSVIQRFMSGAGGYGAMYKSVGFEPSAAAEREGFLDRVGGRVYMDASRAAGMFFDEFPFRYDLDQLRRDPDAGQSPPTVPDGSLRARMRVGRRLGAVNAKLREVAADFDRKLREQVIPPFVDWCRRERAKQLSALSTTELLDLWRDRERRVLDEFAPQSLLPSLISGMALADLRAFLEQNFWDDDPDALSHLLSSAAPADRTAQADALLFQVAQGNRPLSDWLAEYGHRAPGEFDLAAPRWREQPEAAETMAKRLAGGADPAERHHRNQEKVKEKLAVLRAQLPEVDRRELDRLLEVLWRYVPFREDGKYYLMLGYDLLRDVAVEFGRRLEVGEDVFQLTFEDVADALRVGFAPHHLIADRKSRYKAEGRLSVPRVIDASAVETIGQEPEVAAASGDGAFKAFALSAGVATGPARVVKSPNEAGDLGRGYVLVCPSTDPSWTPLFVNAAALVLECGGALSHGAVVAREMGLPAVVLPDATRLLREGEAVRVDGRSGAVQSCGAGFPACTKEGEADDPAATGGAPGSTAERMADAADLANVQATRPSHNEAVQAGKPAPQDNDDTHLPRDLIPPPPGRRERTAGRVRNVAAAAWGVYLLAAFLLPEPYLYQPSLSAIDVILWPLVRAAGKPATVALVAAGLAALTMVIQRFGTDNARLREAKRRAAGLSRRAALLPADSPRRAAMAAAAAPVQWRVLGAAMVPMALLLGPMVMTFMWFPARVDPASWNADPGAAVEVVATVDSNLRTPVMIFPAAPLELDPSTMWSQTPEPIRETLEKHLVRLKVPSDLPDEPWEVKAAADQARAATVADLEAYLKAGVPPRPVAWTVRAPADATGRFTVAVQAGGDQPTIVPIVLGDAAPPAPKETAGRPKSAVISVRVDYPRRQHAPVLWGPLDRAGAWLDRVVPRPVRWKDSTLLKFAWIDHWLDVYLLAYLPALFGLRWALRVA